MTPNKLLLMTAVAAALSTGPVFAGDIYRYTDEDGTVHYVDRPTGEPTEQRLGITSRPTDESAVQARVERRYGSADDEAGGSEDEEAAERKPTRAERAAAKREQEQKCQDARDRLETIVTSRRLYREDESGERVYLEEEDILEARNKAQELVEQNCN